MNLDIFFTAQHQSGPQGTGKATGATGALGGGFGAGGEGGLAGLNFMDMMLGLILEEGQVRKTSQGTDEEKGNEDTLPLQSENPLLEIDPELNIAEILAANPEIAEQVKEFTHSTGLEGMDALEHVLALNEQAFDNVLKPLSDSVVTAEEMKKGSPRLLNALLIDDELKDKEFLNKIEQAIAKIKELKGEGSESLININLTPGQITALERQIEQRIINNDASPADLVEAAEELNELLSGFVGFAPLMVGKAPKDTQNTDQPPAVIAAQIAASGNASPRENNSTQRIAARLNALNAGSGEQDAPITDDTALDGADDFDAALDKAMGKTGKATQAPANSNSPAPQHTANPAVLQFQNMPNVVMDNTLLQNFEMTPGFMDEFAPLAANSNMSMAAMTHLATQAPQAGAMHPAMQTIAAQVQKMAGNGTTEFRLQLDPAELGRIEVQMSFGKDKTLKTGIIVEKPETYMMLQRDAQMLERTMQDLGLESEGIDLQLAEQGFDFDSDNQRGGGHDKGGTGAGDGEEMEIIESTMTWHIDPESGHTRYDIWA